MIPRINTLIHGENSNGVTIRGGASESGAGFFDGGGNPDTGLIWMEDVRITDNAAILQLEDCMVKSTMSGDLTKATGGGAKFVGRPTQLTRVLFSNNSAYYGGGAMIDSGAEVSLTSCTFVGNKAHTMSKCQLYRHRFAYVGETICVQVYHTDAWCVVLCLVCTRTQAFFGGGLQASGKHAVVEIRSSVFESNVALAEGGGMYVSGNAQVRFNNSVVTGCTANVHGGGASLRDDAILTLTSNLF